MCDLYLQMIFHPLTRSLTMTEAVDLKETTSCNKQQVPLDPTSEKNVLVVKLGWVVLGRGLSLPFDGVGDDGVKPRRFVCNQLCHIPGPSNRSPPATFKSTKASGGVLEGAGI